MHKLRNLTTASAALLLLAISPASNAQSMDDIRTIQSFLDLMTSYFEVMEQTYEISAVPEKAAIMQMQKIQEVYEERGEKIRAADVLQEVLDESSNPTLRNAAMIMLGDLYKESGRPDEAVDVLRRGLSENIKSLE